MSWYNIELEIEMSTEIVTSHLMGRKLKGVCGGIPKRVSLLGKDAKMSNLAF